MHRRTTRFRGVVALAAVIALVASVALVACDPPPDPVRPNIILILSDDQAPDLMSKMAYTNGRTDWVRFDHAFLNNPLCCPSRATLLTGQYSNHHLVEENNLGNLLDESNTLPTWLKAAGYRTGLIGKYFNGYPFGRGLYKPAGWDTWEAFKGEAQYYNYSLYENGVTRSYGSNVAEYSTDVLTQKAVDFINTSSAAPFFLYFAPKTPHNPFDVPAPRHTNDPRCSEVGTKTWDAPNFAEADVSDKPAWMRARPLPNVAAEHGNRRKQCEMLLTLDDDVHTIFDALSDKGKLQDTVVIYMTDNGYGNGRHRLSTKRCEYEECIDTPLLIRYPEFTPRTVGETATNVDIAPTIAELAGATPQLTQDGFSLMPLLTNAPSPAWEQDTTGFLIHYIGYGVTGDRSPVPPYWGVRTPHYKYVEFATGDKELYDLDADPWELDNRAGQPEYSILQAELKVKLEHLKSR